MRFARMVPLGVLALGLFGAWSAALADVPRAAITRIETDEAPKIDGRQSDGEIWSKIAPISALTQQFPIERTAPTERTEIRLCYDDAHLYLVFRCYDSEPDQIRATVMQRDQSVGGRDDYVGVLIDPYQTGRDGFYFRMNAVGAKGEGRITGRSSRANMDWDAIWEGKSTRDPEGWTTEWQIPFRSLSFDQNSETWAMNFLRTIARKDELQRWSGASFNRRFTSMEDAGVIRGFHGMTRGLGIDVKPYALGRARTGDQRRGQDDSELDYGGDLFWQVTPSLTATLTWNTDFAEAEVDNRVVNLSRFPLFFPENRDFFLEGTEYFEFGVRSGSLRPFHSRTIGLSDAREKVPILGGAKVTGRIGDVGIGVIGAGLDSVADLQSDEVFAVRMTHDVLEDSRIGAFVSSGDPRQNIENEVYGVDFNYVDRDFIEDNQLYVSVYELMSRGSEIDSEAHAFGANVQYPNDPFDVRLDLRQIDEQFDPGLGFVRRPGTRRLQASTEYDWHYTEAPIREFSLGTGYELTTTLDNVTESMEWEFLEAAAEFASGDEVYLDAEMNREVLFEGFEISDGVVLTPGDYHFNQVSAGFDTNRARPVSLETEVSFGGFWDGTRLSYEAEVDWRPSRFFGAEIGGEYGQFDLEPGEFDVLVAFAGFRVTPSPRLSWNTLAQWDNVSNAIGINSRIRYILSPGSDLFLVVNQGFEQDDESENRRSSYRSTGSETITKLGWTFRF